ncbi:MAG TPA: signal recognition particle-docking protein FtsY [Rhodanobacteraceae bacterium]
MSTRITLVDLSMRPFWKKKEPHKDSDSRTAPATADADSPVDSASTSGRIADSADQPAPASAQATIKTDATASAQPDVPARDPAASTTPSRGWRRRLSGSGFARSLSAVFTRHPKLDDALLDELETVLITADVGVNASMALVEALRTRMHKREFADADALLDALRQELVAQLQPVEQALEPAGHTPFVVLVVGVNGVGKTTTIGKLAHRYHEAGLKLTLAAGDTFRAAAVEQLKTWGERNDVPVVAQGQGADAASVIYDALDAARARGCDVLIADTAGRLHTQSGLMDELAKVVRVMRKLDAQAPHEVLMVIDGTTGQNAINQLRQFHESVGVTGLVVTKLDGTAKGGVVFALAREFGLPIRHIGLGEGIDDLRPFEARAFVDGLLPDRIGNAE